MAKLPLLLYPNPRLRVVSEPLTFDWVKQPGFKERLGQLHETLLWYQGVGISAIQVDWPVRLFLMREHSGRVLTFVNPVISNVDDETIPMEEGCLSVPGVTQQMERYEWVALWANDLETWERKQFDLVGIEAQCVQHEMDHLDGKLFTDDYGLVKRDIVKRKIRKQLRQNPLFKEMQ